MSNEVLLGELAILLLRMDDSACVHSVLKCLFGQDRAGDIIRLLTEFETNYSSWIQVDRSNRNMRDEGIWNHKGLS